MPQRSLHKVKKVKAWSGPAGRTRRYEREKLCSCRAEQSSNSRIAVRKQVSIPQQWKLLKCIRSRRRNHFYRTCHTFHARTCSKSFHERTRPSRALRRATLQELLHGTRG